MGEMVKKRKPEYLTRPACGNCRHWNRLDDVDQTPSEDVLGECVRYPPTVFGLDEDEAALQGSPIVEAQFRCGEHGAVIN